jgi:hypothetical protein
VCVPDNIDIICWAKFRLVLAVNRQEQRIPAS